MKKRIRIEYYLGSLNVNSPIVMAMADRELELHLQFGRSIGIRIRTYLGRPGIRT